MVRMTDYTILYCKGISRFYQEQIKNNFKAWRYTSVFRISGYTLVVENLPNMHKTLDLMLSTTEETSQVRLETTFNEFRKLGTMEDFPQYDWSVFIW